MLLEEIKHFDDLEYKHQKMINKYLECNNQVEAYKYANNLTDNKRSYYTNASKFFTRANIKAIIKERTESINNSAIIKAEQVLEELSKIALGQSEDQFSKKTANKDRIEALKTLGKHYNLFSENNININNQVQTVLIDDVLE